MNPQLMALASRQGHVVLRHQALAAGYDDDEIARLRAKRQWSTVRRGAYVETTLWESMDEIARHRTRIHAALRQVKMPAVASHISAAVLHDLPVWNVDLSAVHLSRTDARSPRLEAGLHHHVGQLLPSEITVIDGLAVTTCARTVIDAARTELFESAVVIADAALARPDVDKGDLMEVLDRMRDWQGARSAGRAVEFADGRSESVGESRHRVQIQRVGLPEPELQVEFLGPGGPDRVDFYFKDFNCVAEFDGRAKYGRQSRDGEPAGEAVWREKIREDRIRESGAEVVRPIWADLYRDDQVLARYRAAFARGRRSAGSR
jgi:hypothetical protein